MDHKVALSFADGTTQFLTVQGNERLLDAALRHGLNIPLDCREGVCGTCRGQCESGQYSLDYADEEALSADELASRYILACQTRVQSDATFRFDFDSSLCNAAPLVRRDARVTALQQVSSAAAILEVEADGAPLDYLPGQYARLQVPGTEAHRAYSFANRPNPGNRLQFLIRLLPQGVMSDYLRERCQVGDTLQLEAPLGAFYLRQVERPVVMAAGGTGLSAFLGMLDTLAEQGCQQPIHLLHGVRQAADLCEQARIEGYSKQLPGFRFTPVVSEPGEADWSGARGYVPEHLDADALREQPCDLYVCGPPPMVDAVKGWLESNALGQSRLYLEKFLDSGT